MKSCKICNKPFKSDKPATKCCSKSCSKQLEKTTHSESRKLRGLKRKLELVNLSGGKCNICGYNKCFRALCFHHIDESTKLFTLDQSTLYQHPINKIYLELKKCKLLCQNCHAIYHEIDRNQNNKTLTKYNLKRRNKYLNKKAKLIEYKGGKCQKCNFSTNYLQCMTFHHLDKSKKIFDLNCVTIASYSLLRLKKECDKCKLLCFNCHMEEEDKLKLLS